MTMKKHSNAGFSLLEVLLAVVILSVGLLALAALQMALMRSSSGSKMQSVAVSLGKQKVEQLRSFRQLSASGGTGTQNPCTNTSNTSYIALTDCTVTQSVGGVTYTIATTITRYVLDAPTGGAATYVNVGDTVTESALSADATHKYVLGRDYKKATVRVSWADSTSATANNSLTLDDVIDGLNPADSAKVAKNTSSLSARHVKVIIGNPTNTAGVIAIPLATGSNEVDTAATNPKPVIDNNATETRFNIYTYAAISGTTTALAQSEVETVMIGCTCDTSAAPTDTSARGYRPTYWNGTRYVAPSMTTYVPPAGQYASKKSSESPYCTICCRDHHDPAGTTTAKFSPWRSTHTHYGLDSSGTLVAVGSNGQTVYKEACRLIRTDGILRVAADYNDEYFDLLKTKNDGSTSEYAPDTTAVSNYQNFVLDYLGNKVVSNGAPSTYNTPVSAATVSTLEATRNINDPASITLQRTNDHKWLHARGLYIDYLEPEALNAIADAKASCVSSGCTTAETQTAVLKLMPFTSINLTELSNWSPLVSDNLYVSISNGAFASSTAYYGAAPLRGYVVPATSGIPSSAQTQNGRATMRNSNSGLQTLYDYAINNDEGSKTDTQSFSIPAGGSPGNGGNFTVAFNGYDFGTFPALSGTNITQCTKGQVGNGNNATYQYTCQSTNLGGAATLNIQNYNYQAPAATGLTITCTGSSGPLPYTTKNNDPALVTCKTYDLTSASSNQSGASVGAPVLTGTGKSQSASVQVSPINAGNTLTLNFSGPTTTFAGYTCTYTQTQSGSPKNPTITSTSANCP